LGCAAIAKAPVDRGRHVKGGGKEGKTKVVNTPAKKKKEGRGGVQRKKNGEKHGGGWFSTRAEDFVGGNVGTMHNGKGKQKQTVKGKCPRKKKKRTLGFRHT